MSLLFGAGNPLLDIIVTVDDAFLNQYVLLPNNAILAEERHMPLFEKVKNMKNVTYVAGGACQNTLRCAQLFLPPGSTVITGATGKDESHKILVKNACEDGLRVIYQQIDNKETGQCAVLVTRNGAARSLVANVAAAQCFSFDTFCQSGMDSALQAVMDASVLCSTGFFLFSCPDAVRELAEIARRENKKFIFNLSSTFVCTGSGVLCNVLEHVIPRCDVILCNSDEIFAFAENRKWPETDILEVMEHFVQYSGSAKEDAQPMKRTLVVTQGPGDVLVIEFDTKNKKLERNTFHVPKIPENKVVDTNGAGDAFAGAYISQLIKLRPLNECVNAGIWAASIVIGQNGVVFPKLNIPTSFSTFPISD